MNLVVFNVNEDASKRNKYWKLKLFDQSVQGWQEKSRFTYAGYVKKSACMRQQTIIKQ